MFVWVFTKALQTCQMAANPGESNFPKKLIAHHQVHEVNPERYKATSECKRPLHVWAAVYGPHGT